MPQLFINITSSCFIEIAKTVYNYLTNKGIHCSISTEMHNKDDYYICIGAHDIFWDISQFYYEVYQFEQIDSPHMKNESYLKILKYAKKVYDFSHIGTKYLQDINVNINVEQKDYVYRFNHKNNNHNISKKYGVSFIGSLNDRRNKIMETMSIHKHNDLSKKEFDNVVNQSIILINLHYYPNAALEVARIEELLSLNAFIISERSADPILDSKYEELIIFIENNNQNINQSLSQIIDFYLSNPEKIKEFCANSRLKCRERQQFDYELQAPPMPLLFDNVLVQNKYPEMDHLPCKSAKTKIIDNSVILDFNSESLTQEPIAIITITRNRVNFIKLLLSNYFSFKYMGKKEWIILDDSPNSYFRDEISKLCIPELNYIWIPHEIPMTIADKRNKAISYVSNDINIIAHMDDDDYYYPHSLYSRANLLMARDNISFDLVGCSNYGIINCTTGNGYLLKTKNIAEASMCYRKSFWQERKFYEHINGEGYAFLKNRRSRVLDMPFEFNFIALNHQNNYTKTLRVRNINNKLLFNSLPNKVQSIIFKTDIEIIT